MSKIKISVNMDEGWHWWPVLDDSATLEVDLALVQEYNAARAAYVTVQEKLEQLYRVQEQLPPWATPVVPPHTILSQKDSQ